MVHINLLKMRRCIKNILLFKNMSPETFLLSKTDWNMQNRYGKGHIKSNIMTTINYYYKTVIIIIKCIIINVYNIIILNNNVNILARLIKEKQNHEPTILLFRG